MVRVDAQEGKRVWRRQSGLNVWENLEIIYDMIAIAVPSLGVALLVADHGSVMAITSLRTNARPLST